MLIIAMATTSHWEDIEEGFFFCSICLDHYKEPKLLPCVHRFCKGCLQKLIEKCLDTVECPLCKEKCDIPKNGTEGFKTDFHMKSLLEVIQVQKSLDKEEIKECVGCSKQQKATSYCFKCTGFLCETCYQFHLDSPMVKDHKQNVVKLKDIQQKGLSLEKLSSLRESPRCDVHPEKLSELCCLTCDNLPVCIACGSYGKHKSHILQEITELASVERRKLVDNLSILDSHRRSVYKLRQEIEVFQEKLSEEINIKHEEIWLKHETEMGKINEILHASRSKLDCELQVIATEKETDLVNLNSQMEKEIQEVREKYNNLIAKADREHEKKCREIQMEQESHDQILTLRLKQLELCKTEFLKRVDQYANETDKVVKILADDSDNILARFDDYRTLGKSILASKNDLTDVHCLPDINAAFKTMVDNIEVEKFPDATILPDIKVPISHVCIAEQPDPIVYIDKFAEKNWKISGIASVENGKIVVTGSTKYGSHITVTNNKGEVIYQFPINAREGPRSSYCASISPTKVAIAIQPSEIGIFNIRGYNYTSKNIEDLTTEWTQFDRVRCVAFDPINANTFIGTESRKVLIFDNEMNYRMAIFLPGIIKYVSTMEVHGGKFLVCDRGPGNTERAYSLTMNDDNSFHGIFQFDVPDICKGNWRTYDVYIDESELIYVVWEVALEENIYKGFVVQYSQDGKVKLSTREMKVSRITTVKAEGGEMLVGTSFKKGKMVIYQLARM